MLKLPTRPNSKKAPKLNSVPGDLSPCQKARRLLDKQKVIPSETQWGHCQSSAVVFAKCTIASYIAIVLRQVCVRLHPSNHWRVIRHLGPMLRLPKKPRPESSTKLPSMFSLPGCSYVLRTCTWTQTRNCSNDIACNSNSVLPMEARNTSCRQLPCLFQILKWHGTTHNMESSTVRKCPIFSNVWPKCNLGSVTSHWINCIPGIMSASG